jgi:hypothetical protein
MTDLSSTLQVVLQESQYKTWLTPSDHLPTICFEDDTLIGFAHIYDNTTTLLSRWRASEERLLSQYALHLRQAEEKAWNVYSMFLSAEAPDETQRRELRQLEENLEQTRKIAAGGLNSRDDLITAILPILPLQYRPRLDNEDLTDRLRRRIATIAPAVAQVVLDIRVPAPEVVKLLGAEK